MLYRRKHASFGAHHKNLNDDRLSAAKMQANDSNFWRYKVYADIRGDSLGRGRQTTVGLSTLDNGNFHRFRWLFFSETLEMRPTLLYSDTQFVVSFQWSQNA